MKRKRFTEEQIISILKQADRGATMKELGRIHGVSQSALFRWKTKYGGMEVSDARKLKALEAENARLKRMIAEQALDIQILKDVNSKKW